MSSLGPSESSSSSPAASKDASVIESTLHLQDGRVMHYALGGDVSSRRIFIGLHGVFGVGSIPPYTSRMLARRGWLSLAPTLPGWGESSPFPASAPVSAYVSDIRELVDAVMAIKHEAGTKPTHVVIFGGSYGSVWAYSVAANSPPTPSALRLEHSSLRGLIIMGGFSPFHDHSNYSEGMSMMNYLTVSKIGLYAPFRWMHSLMGSVIRKQVANNIEGSLNLIRHTITGEKAMNSEERAEMTKWAAKCGVTFEEWELSMAKNVSKSLAVTMDGFNRVCETLNSDWGFRMENIQINTNAKLAITPALDATAEEATESKKLTTNSAAQSTTTKTLTLPVLRISGEHPVPEVLPPIVLCGAIRDRLAHIQMIRWVNAHIPHSQLLEMSGNHISGITLLMPIIEAVINGIERDDEKSTDSALTPKATTA